jgi:uncharacterized membrane protein
MNFVNQFIQDAEHDKPVYITRVRNRFLQEAGVAVVIHILRFDGSTTVFSLRLPANYTGDAQRDFVKRYIFAEIHNILSALGGEKIDIYINTQNEKITGLLREINSVFGIGLNRRERPGYGRSINVIERMLDSLGGGKKFYLTVQDIKDMPHIPVKQKRVVNFIET